MVVFKRTEIIRRTEIIERQLGLYLQREAVSGILQMIHCIFRGWKAAS